VDAREAEEALAQAARHREATVAAGSAPWSGKATWSFCSAALALGVLTDAGMIWLWVILMVMGVGFGWRQGVRLTPTAASRSWTIAFYASFLAVFAGYVLAQIPARALDWPFPNTVGAIGACVVIVALVRPIQAGLARSLRR
jgi:hypothetical protein